MALNENPKGEATPARMVNLPWPYLVQNTRNYIIIANINRKIGYVLQGTGFLNVKTNNIPSFLH